MILLFTLLNFAANVRAQSIAPSTLTRATRVALQLEGLRTFREVALAEEGELYDGVLNRRQFHELHNLLTLAGLRFGQSPFKELKLAERVALHRLGVESLAAFFAHAGAIGDAMNLDDVWPHAPKWRLRMITERSEPPGLRAHRLLEGVGARLKELEELVAQNGLEVMPFDDEVTRLVKEIRRREALIARCERHIILSR